MEEFIIPLTEEEEKIKNLVEPLLDSEGYELVSISLKRAQTKSLLNLFVDLKGEENITIKDLENISRYLSDILDASLIDNKAIMGRYNLEVSSPGIDRPISKKSHFLKAKGKKIKVHLNDMSALDEKKIIGILNDVVDDGISITKHESIDSEVMVPFSHILKAHIIFEFPKKGRK